MPVEVWIIYVAAVIGLLITPGNMSLLALSHGMRYGAKKSIGTALGSVCAGFLVMSASSLGLGAIIQASDLAFQTIKWLGAAYLIYLGISSWRANVADMHLEEAHSFEDKRASALFIQSLLTGLGNPKGLIFFAAFFPQFINKDLPQIPQLVTMGTTFMFFDFTIMMLYAIGAHHISKFIQSPRHRTMFNRVTGAIFIFAGTLLAFVAK